MELAKLTVIALILSASAFHGELFIATSMPEKSTARLADDLVSSLDI